MPEKYFLLKVALRNLGRHPRRTILLILGIALANALTLWILTFRQTTFKTMMDNILGMKYGQEQITAPEYYDFDKGSINPFKIIHKDSIEKLPHTYTLRTQGVVLLASQKNAFPILMNGYDMKRELELSRLSTLLKKDFKFQHKFPLILGKRLALALAVHEGDEVAVIGQAVDGSVANELFTVEKILDLGGGEFEKTFAVTDLASMQEFLSMSPDQYHLLVNFGDPIQGASLLEKVQWQKLLPQIASSSGFMDRFTKFYAIFFALVAGIAMANTLSLSFLERVKEYKMTTIIGAPPAWIRKSIALEIFLVSVTALIIGNIVMLTCIGIFNIIPLNLSLLTGGTQITMGGIHLSQDMYLNFYGWVFLSCNVFLIITLIIASFYPLRIVLKKSRTE
ncbi:ABC transporter permease [Peredibacter sp. HCB2-198]|uniref:ABC transporter permease n=1 Tax=Peredibacter sp. HCB2-198 TaxID=3383025 RepID=UPI0038B482AE